MKIARRIQALGLVLALLALPLAVIAAAYACAPQSCSMLCCAAHRAHSMNGKHMDCAGSKAGSSMCFVKCNSQPSPDFSLIPPLPPTQLSSAPYLPSPELAQVTWFSNSPEVAAGFSLLPFQPPRS